MEATRVRDRWLAALGGFPERTPLDARVVERVEEPALIRERVWFWSEAHEPVGAFLFIPKGRVLPAPAAICLHQHNGEFAIGKSEAAGLRGNPDLAHARDLALRGYVTLALDFKGFEERGDPVLEGQRFERYLATRALVEGDTLQRRHLWDMMRGVDYLHERPEVDTRRIGCIGHSLGGQEAFFLMATDPRVRVGVPHCGVGTVRSFFEDRITHNPAWYLPGYLALGDTPALVELIVPRPLYLIAGTHDRLFPVRGVQAVADRARERYAALGHADAFAFTLFAGGHEFLPENRALAYAWLDRWLMDTTATA